jgi:phosphoglycolate phosphatase
LLGSLLEVLKEEPGEPLVLRVMDLYLEEYGRHLLDTTRLLQGVEETLRSLDWACLAVVTNKPERFSRQILDALGIGQRFRLVLGGDSTRLGNRTRRRCGSDGSLRCDLERHGDGGSSAVDIRAGKAAGAVTCGIAGDRGRQAKLEAAGCDLLISDMRN